MPLQILSSPSNPDDLAEQLSTAVAGALPGAEIEVRATGAGHFEIRVTSSAFADKSRVAQRDAEGTTYQIARTGWRER